MGEYYAPGGPSAARPAVGRRANPVRPRRIDPVLCGGCAVVVIASMTVRVDLTAVVTGATAVLLWARWQVMSWGVLAVLVIIATIALGRSAVEQRALSEAVLGPHEGWVTVRGEPRVTASAVRAVVVVDGQRYEVWGRSSTARRELAAAGAGDRLYVLGERRSLSPERAEVVAWQHVIGEYRVSEFVDTAPGTVAARLSGAVRSSIRRGADQIPDAERALFSGLVIGDRRGQSSELTARFRDSGLSHLLVVSGLNVTLLLVGLSPLLVRLAPMFRWLMTVIVVVWFAGLTHFEPSIMRASAMAVISVTAFSTGRSRDPTRMLMLAVLALVLIDPLVVRSVGMWLSASATAGVCAIAPAFAARARAMPRYRARYGGGAAGVARHRGRRRCVDWFVDSMAVAAGAQAGVAIPLMATFGSMPLISIPANLVAVPIASAVKLYGLPAALITGMLPAIGPVLMWPAVIGTWLVDRIAAMAVMAEPAGSVRAVIWVMVVVGVAVVWWNGRRARSAATTWSRNGRLSVDR